MAVSAVNPGTVRDWLARGEAVLVDVREPAEHSAAHIEGAQLVPLGRIRAAALSGTAGRKLVIHCQKGGRGASACEKLLAENPALEIYNLSGGLEAWRAAGLPVRESGRTVLPLDRQVQLVVGLGLIAAALLSLVSPFFLLLVLVFGCGLTLAGLTGFCGMARLLARMPWNQRA